MNLEAFEILGVRVHKIETSSTILAIEEFIAERKPRLIVTLGTEMVMAAQKDRQFRDVLNSADLLCADAVGIVWASKIVGQPLKEKVAGIDILLRLAALSGDKGWSLFFLGASEGTAEAAIENLTCRFPGMRVAGWHHGYFKDDGPVIAKIRESNPDILLVALGSPRQEFWFSTHKEELGVPVGIGVGGSFDVLSGKLSRSPQWMIRLGLEWLYRLYKEPWRWRRMLVLPIFALRVLLGGKKRK